MFYGYWERWEKAGHVEVDIKVHRKSRYSMKRGERTYHPPNLIQIESNLLISLFYQ